LVKGSYVSVNTVVK